jgi:hypothetical protein
MNTAISRFCTFSHDGVKPCEIVGDEGREKVIVSTDDFTGLVWRRHLLPLDATDYDKETLALFFQNSLASGKIAAHCPAVIRERISVHEITEEFRRSVEARYATQA